MRSQIIYRNYKNDFFDFYSFFSNLKLKFKKTISQREILPFIKSIADFLSVNNDIIFAIESSMHCLSKNCRPIIENIILKIQQGESIGSVFNKFNILPVYAINILNMGEKNVMLEQSFLNIFNLMQWNQEQKSKLKKALIYPIFTFCVFLFVMFLFTNCVVPAIVELMDSINYAGKDKVLFLYDFLFYCNFFLFAIAGFTIIMALIYFVNPCVFQNILIKLPFIGSFIKIKQIYMFSYAMENSLKSGVSIIESLNASLDGCNGVFYNIFNYVKSDLIKGNKLCLSFAKFSLIPDDFKKILKTGENSGKLASAFQSINKIYAEKYKNFIENCVNVFPLVFVIFTSILMLVFVSLIFVPIYNISSAGF